MWDGDHQTTQKGRKKEGRKKGKGRDELGVWDKGL